MLLGPRAQGEPESQQRFAEGGHGDNDPALSAAAGPIVAIIATDHVAGWERLGAVVTGVERLLRLELRQERALVVRTMAVLAGGLVALHVVVVAINPALADGMETVRPAAKGYGHGIVAHSTLANRSLVALQVGTVHVVVHL